MVQAVERRITRSDSWAGRAHAVARFSRRKPLGAAAAVVLLIVLLLAVFADLVAPYDPIAQDSFAVFLPPHSAHWLGTDNLGRDVYSRIIHGSRVSLIVGFGAIALGCITGGILGLASGYILGVLDLGVQRVVDVLQALPTLIMAMVVVAALGPSLTNTTLALGIVMIPQAVRVVRASTITIRETEYITAARAIGASDMRIIVLHTMPNAVAPFIVLATALLGAAVLTEASLSFLGLGVPEPTPAWGSMLSKFGAEYARQTPWIVLSPGIAISITVIAFNLWGDALRDILDPRLRGE